MILVTQFDGTEAINLDTAEMFFPHNDGVVVQFPGTRIYQIDGLELFDIKRLAAQGGGAITRPYKRLNK